MPALKDGAELLAEGWAGHSGGEQGEAGTLAAQCGWSREGFLDKVPF